MGILQPAITTKMGALFHIDCLTLLPQMQDESVDCVFADPPFNLGKVYGDHFSDRMTEGTYLGWCQQWLSGCIRILKPGGSLFVYNIPKWQIFLAAFMMGGD